MSKQIINENNQTNKTNLNFTNDTNNLNDEEYQYLIMISFIKMILSIFIFIILISIKYFKIYYYLFNEQNNKNIIFFNCFSGGFFFYISFIYSSNKTNFNIYPKNISFLNNINSLEIISFFIGFFLIFFIRKIIYNSISFYIPLIIQNDISKKETNNETNNNIKNNNINTNIIPEINESKQVSFNMNENKFKYNNSFIQKYKKYNNIEMNIIERNENEYEFKKEKISKENSFSNKNSYNNSNYNNSFNKPFKDADNDEETNEEFFFSIQEKQNKKIKKKYFTKNKKILNSQIPKFNLNATKVKKNEKVKEENIHKIGTKINKEVFDIAYKSEKEVKNQIIAINLCNKDFFKLIVYIIVYNIYFLFIGILVGFSDFEGNILIFTLFILLTLFRIIYEKNNMMYNNDLIKNEPIIQKALLIIIDSIFPSGIVIGNKLINLYYKTSLKKYCYLIILMNGISSGNLLFCGIFLFYIEETKNNTDIQSKFLFFSIGIITSFIITSINY